MRIAFTLLFLLLTNQLVFGQRDKEHLIDFRSKENRHYWKNKLPKSGYWQQDVHYEIKASIDDSTDIISGDFFKLTYYNNSSDTLKELYFHLFQNAFQPGSYYHSLNVENDIPVKFGNRYEAKRLGTEVEDMRVNGQQVTTHLDNTVLQVILNAPLLPNDSLVVTCQFKTYFDDGSMRRRMDFFESWGYKHYNGVHWYPAITVYDEKFGWNTDQHLDKEFYNNFGQFDIELTFPQEYIVDATGVLVNREEVMPDSLRAKLDMKNFAEKPFNETPSVIIPREKGKTKTWKYHAINVHNFAFTADPTYRIDEVEWNGVKVVALAQEPHASKWQQSAEFTAVIIKIYSTDFGMYDWPKIIVSDARDGMEYPMLTLDGGTYPQHQSLLAHEVGHMWFYGMVANNETYRAFIDEGFTQFLTVWGMDKLMGGPQPRTGANKFITKYLDPSDVRYSSLYYPYLNHVVEGYDERLNQHSAAFNGAIRHGGNYGLVYYKAGTMLYNLRYVLGDELFIKAMQYYVKRWKFAHPYPEDFRQAIIDYTNTDLNWFFDQWLESEKFIDYGIKKVEKVSEDEYDVTFIRKGRMHMPVDFTVTTKDSVDHQFIIPNTWFVKQTNATVLPKWYGWDLVFPTYTARIKIPGEIISIEIDPDHYLADMDLRDNKIGKGGISTWQFDHRVPNTPSWTNQRNYWRPDVWYNNFDGIQAGLAISGKYFKQASYSAIGWLNTGLFQNDIPEDDKDEHQWVAFDIRNRNSLYPKIWRNLTLYENAYYNAGIWKLSVGLEKVFQHPDQRVSEYSKIFLNTKYLINEETIDKYLLYPNQWGMEGRGINSYVNSSINFGYYHRYTYTKGYGDLTITTRVPSVRSDYNYSYINLESVNSITLKKLDLKSRVFGQWGYGNFPLESQLYLAGANPEQLLENRFTRAAGFVPSEWASYIGTFNHFQYGGGLNLRGYAGYVAPEIVEVENGTDTIFFAYAGKAGASWSGELDFDKLINIPAIGITKNFHLDTYLFSDLGFIGFDVNNKLKAGSFRMDAGIGTALTFKFSPYDINPVTVRFDVPLFLNRPPFDNEYFEFRYLIGINRSF